MTATEYQTAHATDNPALTERIVRQALAEPPPLVEETRSLRTLPVTSLRLPGGYETSDGFVFDVEVRELNGEDEEALAKSPNMARALMTVINRATVRIGDKSATPAMLDSMLAGDREMVLLQIRKATYGSVDEYEIRCIECNTDQTTVIDLDKDVKVKTLADPQDRYWELPLRIGTAALCLPDGAAQRKVAGTGDKTVAEINTILISECLTRIDDMPSLGTSTARALGLADREAIINSIAARQPGPELGEVIKSCESCGAKIAVPLNLAHLFRF